MPKRMRFGLALLLFAACGSTPVEQQLLTQFGEDLIDLGAALGRDGKPQCARTVRDSFLRLAHDEVIVAA